MKIRKLLERVRILIDPKKRKSKERKKNLKHVLKKLRKQEKSLLKLADKESSKPKAAKLKERANLAHAQRKKGVKVLKGL